MKREAAKRDDPSVRRAVEEAIERHRAAGREFGAGGARSFVREQGDGDPVVLMHGIPVSSFLYRKVLPLLAERGLRGVAFDLPGLGLAERPKDFDYTWSGLGRWTGEAVDELGIDRCHLVLHDIGGPIGLEWALRNPDRVRSLTVLDTLINQGIADRSATPAHEVDAHLALLLRGDGGRAFQRIVRGFEPTTEKERLYTEGLADVDWPATILWGERDPALGEREREAVERALGMRARLLPAKHFLQEDQAPAVADAVAGVAGSA
jgi:haloalkane dehalogenase